MARRTVRIPSYTAPTGEALAQVRVEIQLVDAAHRPIVGYTDSQGLIGAWDGEIGAAGLDVDLTPQNEIAEESFWRISATQDTARWR